VDRDQPAGDHCSRRLSEVQSHASLHGLIFLLSGSVVATAQHAHGLEGTLLVNLTNHVQFIDIVVHGVYKTFRKVS
jgi:hypothetical protein